MSARPSARVENRNATSAATLDRAGRPATSGTAIRENVVALLEESAVIVPFEVSDGGPVPADWAHASAADSPEWYI